MRQRSLCCVSQYDCARPPGKQSDYHELHAKHCQVLSTCNPKCVSSIQPLIICRHDWLVLYHGQCSKVLTTDSFEATCPVAVGKCGRSAWRTPSLERRSCRTLCLSSPEWNGQGVLYSALHVHPQGLVFPRARGSVLEAGKHQVMRSSRKSSVTLEACQ